MSMARLAYTMAPHQVALDQRKLLLLLLVLSFQLLLAQTHATERRKPVLTDPSSEPLLGKGLDLVVVRVVPKEVSSTCPCPCRSQATTSGVLRPPTLEVWTGGSESRRWSLPSSRAPHRADGGPSFFTD